MKIIYFYISALAVLGTILLSAFSRKMAKGKANSGFLLATAEVFVTTLFGTFAIYFDNLGYGYETEKWIFHAGYLLFHTLTAAFYLYYLILLTDTIHNIRHNKLLTAALTVPSVVMVAATVINIFTPLLFYIDGETGLYTRGYGFVTGYLVGAIYLAYGVGYILCHRELFNLRWIVLLFSPFPLIICSMVVEFIMPYTVIELFVNSLALMFIYTNIQKPDELIDSTTGFGNTNAYEACCRKAFINKKPLREIFIAISNYSALRDVLGFDERTRLNRIIAADINRINKSEKLGADRYSANDGRFFLLIEEKNFEKVERCAALINSALNASHIFGDIEISPSAAVCVINLPEDISDFDRLVSFNYKFEKSDDSKDIIFASEILGDRYYKILLDIDRIIETAFAKNRLEVYYQPIYSVGEKRFSSAEALLRLKDDEYGFVPPDIFIPAAERSGAIHRIDDFVLDSVCGFIAEPGFEKLGLDYIDINLSPVQCMQNNITGHISAILKKRGISNDKICFEITETAISQFPKRLRDNLLELSEAGFCLSLDDFGSGYSNFRRIAGLHVDIVKLDKTFVTSNGNEKTDVLLRKTVEMLKAIGTKIVAEGIESEETAKRVETLGCDYIQGYFYSRPVPKGEFVEFLSNQKYIAPM